MTLKNIYIFGFSLTYGAISKLKTLAITTFLLKKLLVIVYVFNLIDLGIKLEVLWLQCITEIKLGIV